MNFRHEARRRKIGSRPLRSRLVRIGIAGIGMLAVGSSHNSSPFDSRGSRSGSGSGYACGTIIVAVDAFLPLPRGVRSPGIRPAPEQYGWYLSATNQNESEGGEEAKKKKKKKKKKSRRLVINPNLDRDLFSGGSVATITSDGVVKVATPASTKRATRSSKLGVPTKPRKTKASALPKGANSSGNKRLSAKATKLRNQRTAGGTIDSTSSSRRANASAGASAGPADEAVRIATAKRGSKTVTMVQGMVSASSDERKRLLKKLKARVGGGGTLVEGVLELQGSHAETVLSVLVSEGYAKARVVGGGTNKKKKKK